MATLEQSAAEQSAGAKAKPHPRFAAKVEPHPLGLPPGKKLGSVLAVAIAPNRDIFLVHQPNAQGLDPELVGLDCWLPPLVHLTPEGDFVDAWGGPDHIPSADGVSQWPEALEGLDCDDDGNLWIVGFKQDDDAVLKFSQEGELLLRIGQRGIPGSATDTQHLGAPTSCFHDTKTREVFVSDGYRNRRVISFDADTGAFRRMWGAYGKDPASMTPEEGFGEPVHKVIRGPNGLFYVADRTKSRIQEFEVTDSEVRYLREVVIAPGTSVFQTGSTWDVNFSTDGAYMLVNDASNFRVWSVDLESFEVLGSTSVYSEYENERNRPLHFEIVHRFAVKDNGDLLLAGVDRGLMLLRYEGVR